MTKNLGWVKLHREFDKSEIATKPPCVREIFLWLLRSANFKDNEICKRGQCVRTYDDIQEGLKWFVGYRKMVYSRSQIEKSMKTLTKTTMIETTKTTRGMIVTICNYDKYQDNYEHEEYNEEYNEGHTKNIDVPHYKQECIKKEKKEKNKHIVQKFVPPSLGEVKSYCQKRNNRVDPELFMSHYESNGWMVGRTRMKDWQAAVRTWEKGKFDKGGKRDITQTEGYKYMQKLRREQGFIE